MKIGRFTLTILATAAVMLFAVSFAQAQNNRSWVSSTGDDNAACTRTAPCRTFQGAHNKTNPQGEIDVIDAGEYSNAVSNVGAISAVLSLTITKSITIDGGGLGFITGGNANGADAVVVNVTDLHDVVTLRQLSINGVHVGGVPSAFFDGVRFGSGGATAGSLVLEHCQISNFSRGAVNFTPSSGGSLFVRDCEFTNNEFFGIQAQSTTSGVATCSIDNVRASNNGIFGTGSGFQFFQRTQAIVSDSVVSFNGLNGIQASPQAGTAEVNIESTNVVGNNINLQAGFSAAPATIRISNVDIFDATANGLTWTAGSNILSFGNNRIAGNVGSNGPPSGTLPQQ